MERIMKLFKEKYNELELKNKEYGGDKLVLDTHKLQNGIYLKTSLDGQILDTLIVNQNTDRNTDLYKWFAIRDIYSGYINQNPDYLLGGNEVKKIQSTNCYSFAFKAKTLGDILETNDIKREKKTDKLQFQNSVNLYYDKLKNVSPSNEKLIDDIRDMFLDKMDVYYDYFYKLLIDNFKEPKEEILKIFIDVGSKKYKQENELYYRNNKKSILFNEFQDGEERYGISNLITLNKDKPFLTPTTLNNGFSQTVEIKEAILNYKFLLWLKGQPSKFYIPMNYDFSTRVNINLKDIKEEYVYYIKKTIDDGLCNVIIVENKKEIDFEIVNLFESVEKLEEDFKITELWRLLSKINYVYFKETNNKIKVNKTLKDELIRIKNNYKNTVNQLFNQNDINTFIDNGKIYKEVLKTYLLYGESKFDLMKLINLNQSLINYKNKGDEEDMQDRLYEIREKLDNINWKQNYVIEDDVEFAYIGGQLANYFNYIRQSKEKHYDFVINFINNLNVNIFIDNIIKAFQKSSYKISAGSRSNVLLNALLSYKAQNNKINKNVFIVGSIDNNYILKKNQNKKDNKNNEKEGR